ncbi:hypothetical protein OTU49_016324, partial [Cherax quadricarinatus]
MEDVSKMGVASDVNKMGVPSDASKIGVPSDVSKIGVPSDVSKIGVPSDVSKIGVASDTHQHIQQVMQRTRSGGSGHASRLVPKKIWRARSKSQSRASVGTTSIWTPM